MGSSDALRSSPLLSENSEQQPSQTVSANTTVQPPEAANNRCANRHAAHHTVDTATVTAAPAESSSPQSPQPASEPATAMQHPPASIPDLPSIDFAPAGKIESAEFALYAQMHLHNPQFHQQQWERSECSPPHPVIESFPSFRTPRASETSTGFEVRSDLTTEQQQQGPALTGAAAVESGIQLAKSPDDQQPSSSSHSGLSSPTQQQQEHSAAAAEAARRRSVSLLSQQIATARSASAAAAAVECDAGASGRHRSEFWRYLQVKTIPVTHASDAVVDSSSARWSVGGGECCTVRVLLAKQAVDASLITLAECELVDLDHHLLGPNQQHVTRPCACVPTSCCSVCMSSSQPTADPKDIVYMLISADAAGTTVKRCS